MEILIPAAAAPSDTTPLDAGLFAQALAVLERERPSPRAERLFYALNWLMGLALGTTTFYLMEVLLLGVTIERAQAIAIVALAFYLSIIPASIANLAFLKRLLRGAALRRRLAPAWRTGLQARFRARSRSRRIVSVAARLGLVAVGTFFILFGVIGVLVELVGGRDPFGLGLASLMMLCGATAFLLLFGLRERERMHAVRELRTSLVNSRSGDDEGALRAREYDAIAKIDRRQIGADRERSIKATMRDDAGYRYVESVAVRDVKQVLEPTELMGVLSHIKRLIGAPPQDGPPGGGLLYHPVEGTDLEVGFSVDHDAHEIRLVSLTPVGVPRPIDSPREQADAFEYKVALSKSVQGQRPLSPEARKAVDELVSELAQDPAKYDHLAAPTGTGQLVLRHPSPALELTYAVDHAEKTLNLVHVSAAMQARQSLFVSYSHEDKGDFADVMRFLMQLQAVGLVEIWHDNLIQASERWEQVIRRQLESATAALLLVSQGFINSKFVNEVELPYLLAREKTNQTKIFWVPVQLSTVEHTHPQIWAFQSLLKPPTTPLQELREQGKGRLDRALLDIHNQLRQVFRGG